MKIFLIILLLCGLIFKKASNQIEAGKINQEKSFDQIFGQRWDDGEEENICRIDEIIQGQNVDQNNQFGQNDQQIDQNFDENMEVKEEESEEMSTNCDEMCVLTMSTNNGQIFDNFLKAIDKKKREIVEKFHLIREKINQMGQKYSTKEWQKIERKIAKNLGENRNKIYEWKREFGLITKNCCSNEEKRKILKQFDQINDKIKIKLNEKLYGKKQKCQKIIAKHLGISLKSIYKWKKQLKNGKPIKNQKNDDEKREIVEKYFKIKNEFIENGKHSRKEWKEFRAKIKQSFEVSDRTIEKWAKNLGIEQNNPKKRKMFTIVEKMEMMKQYYIVKKENPKLSDRKITKLLNIELRSLKRYKSEFKEKLELF